MKLYRSILNYHYMRTIREMEKEMTVKAPWGKIAGITWGDQNNPPVLLCTGRISPCSYYRPLVMRLPTNFFYVAIDLPGNGLSDHLPPGPRFTIWDLVPTVARVAEYFKWNKFTYIGHSLGSAVGRYYMMAYPDRLTRVVDLDPVPTYHTVLLHEMRDWYHEKYGRHYEENEYRKHTGGKETAPKYTYDQVKTAIMKAEGLSEAAVEGILPRYIEPAGDNLYRFTYDQRMKSFFKLPFQPEQLKMMYTSHNIPILSIFATMSIEQGSYSRVPFVFDEEQWPHKNYKFMIVEGGHDVHTENPECMADDIARFILRDVKAKL